MTKQVSAQVNSINRNVWENCFKNSFAAVRLVTADITLRPSVDKRLVASSFKIFYLLNRFLFSALFLMLIMKNCEMNERRKYLNNKN